jgi:hypothetical protein
MLGLLVLNCKTYKVLIRVIFNEGIKDLIGL